MKTKVKARSLVILQQYLLLAKQIQNAIFKIWVQAQQSDSNPRSTTLTTQ